MITQINKNIANLNKQLPADRKIALVNLTKQEESLKQSKENEVNIQKSQKTLQEYQNQFSQGKITYEELKKYAQTVFSKS